MLNLKKYQMTRLTPEILLTHGFVELEKKNIVGRPIYSLKDFITIYGAYPFDIQVVLNPQFPDSNANSGIVSIHCDDSTVQCVPEDLWDKEDWTEEDQKRSDEHTMVFEGFTQPIAWHVTTFERLRSIIEPLTLTTLEYGK
jgi:hypothetical protein